MGTEEFNCNVGRSYAAGQPTPDMYIAHLELIEEPWTNLLMSSVLWRITIIYFEESPSLRFWKSSGRWAFVSLVLLLISCFFFLGLDLEAIPWTWAMALLLAVFVAGFIPFFCRSFSISSMSRGSSMVLKNCLRSSSTLMGTRGSFG